MTRPGLTLIELVVVLAILATLTLVAVVSTEGVVEQGRFDVTQRALQNIDEAVLGPAGQPDAPSFIADVGRLPQAWIDPTDATNEIQPGELWANVNGIRAFGPATDSVDTEVSLLVGWRGPYLRLPPGQTRLRDGWGRPFAFFQPDVATPRDTPVTAAGQPVASAASLGGAIPPYDATSLVLASEAVRRGWTGTVQGSIEDTGTTTNATAPATVRLFVPDVSKPGGIRVMTYVATAPGYRFVFPVPPGDAYHSSADADSKLPLPIGPKAIRIQQNGVKGPIVYLRVPPGGLTRTLNFDLQ
ncbi:MAG: prepilin-type N-terminal cleavage/methylation domain-containing protein [Gemmataceae bacterium]